MRLGIAVGLLGAASYGINVPFASLAQTDGISAQQLSLYRSLGMAVLLIAYCLILGQSMLPARGERLRVVMAGLVSGCISLGYLASVKFNPVALSVVLLYTYPMIIIVIEAVLARRFPNLVRTLVFVVAFIGTVIAVGPSLSGASLLGISLAMVGSVGSAILFVLATRIKSDGASTMLTMQLIIVPMSAAVMLMTGDSFGVSVFMRSFWPSLFAMLGYAIGFFAIVFAAPRTGSTNLGLVFLIEPVIGIISASIILSQKPTVIQWIGVGIIIAARAVDALTGKGRRASARPDG